MNHDEPGGPPLTVWIGDVLCRQTPKGLERPALPPRWTDEPFADLTLPDAVGDGDGDLTGLTKTAELLYSLGVRTVGEFRKWLEGTEVVRLSRVGPHGDSMVSCSVIRVRSLVERLEGQEAERDRVVGQ